MATNVYSIGATARDYSTISGWEAATDYGLVAATTIERGEMYDDADLSTSNVVIAGATVSAAYHRVLTAASGEEYDPITDTGVWITGSNATAILNPQEQHTKFSFFGIENLSTGDVISRQSSNSFGEIHGCYGESQVGVSTNEIFGAYSNSHVTSNIAVGGDGSGGCRKGFNVLSSNSAVLNNCAYNMNNGSGDGVGIAQSNYRTQNNICMGCIEEDFDINNKTGQDHNCSSDTTATGTGSITSQTDTDIWNAPAAGDGDFRLKASSNAIDAGTDVSAYGTQESFVRGVDHGDDSGSWNMGAYDGYVAAGGGTDMFGTIAVGATVAGVPNLRKASTTTIPVGAAVASVPNLRIAMKGSIAAGAAVAAVPNLRAATSVAVAALCIVSGTLSATIDANLTSTISVGATVSAVGSKLAASSATIPVGATVAAIGTKLAATSAAIPVGAAVSGTITLISTGAISADISVGATVNGTLSKLAASSATIPVGATVSAAPNKLAAATSAIPVGAAVNGVLTLITAGGTTSTISVGATVSGVPSKLAATSTAIAAGASVAGVLSLLTPSTSQTTADISAGATVSGSPSRLAATSAAIAAGATVSGSMVIPSDGPIAAELTVGADVTGSLSLRLGTSCDMEFAVLCIGFLSRIAVIDYSEHYQTVDEAFDGDVNNDHDYLRSAGAGDLVDSFEYEAPFRVRGQVHALQMLADTKSIDSSPTKFSQTIYRDGQLWYSPETAYAAAGGYGRIVEKRPGDPVSGEDWTTKLISISEFGVRKADGP